MTPRPEFLLLAPSLLVSIACVAPGHERRAWNGDGHDATAEVHTTIEADTGPLLDEIRAQIEQGIERLDARRASSEIQRLNRAPRGEFQHVDDVDVFRCVALAFRHARESDGAYDPTFGALELPGATGSRTLSAYEYERRIEDAGWSHVTLERDLRSIRLPESTLELDLGAVGRGCVLDWATRLFARPGTRAGLLGIDRMLWAWRAPPGATTWHVAVEDPRAAGRALLAIGLANRALATAAVDPSRGPADAILDRETGGPVSTDVRVAVAIADSAADAAAVAHELVAAGPLEAARILGRTPGAEAVLVLDDSVLASASLEGRIELSPEIVAETGGRLRYLLPPAPS